MANPSDPDDSMAGQTGAFAASTSRRMPVWGAFAVTAGLILVSGLALYLGRAGIAGTLESLAPPPPVEIATPSQPELASAAQPSPPGRPEPPPLTAAEVEAKLAPLPTEIRALLADGRGELPELAGRGSSDETQARVMENRWQAWGRTWRNRLRLIRQKMPPQADCERYPELATSCHELRVVFGLVDHAADQATLEEAAAYFDDAEGVLKSLPALRGPALEEEAAPEDAEAVE